MTSSVRRVARNGLWAIAIIVLAGILGSAGGSLYHEYSTERGHQRSLERERSVFYSQIQGIAQGELFPDIPVWKVGTDSAFNLSELTPNGAIVFLMSPGCGSCIDMTRTIADAYRSLNSTAIPLLLIADHPETAAGVVDTLSGIAPGVPYYCDQMRSFRDVHHVRTQKAYFIIDRDNRLEAFGPGKESPDQYTEVFHQSSMFPAPKTAGRR